MPTRYEDFDFGPVRQAHEAFWAGQLDRPLVLLSGQRKDAPATQPWQGYIPAYGDMPVEQIVDIAEASIRATWYAGDGYPYLFTNYGAGSAAAYTGLARAQYSGDGGVWFCPAVDTELADLRVEPRTDTQWFDHTDGYMRAIVDRIGGKTQITLPDLGGMLDILASIRTTETLLTDLIDAPDEVERLVWEVFEAWWAYYEHFYAILKGRSPGCMAWAPAWSPKRTYMFQSDFAYMVSPQMCGRLVIPELTECCRRVDHGFYHLDGVGQLPHLELFLGIDELRGIQWVPGAGKANPCKWPDVFKRILAAGKRVQTWAMEPDEIFEAIEYTMGGRGIIFQVYGVGEDDADGYVDKVLCAASRTG